MASTDPEYPVIFLLHALGGSHRAWSDMTDKLDPALRAVAIDLPGFGNSHDESDYSVEGMADFVVAAIKANGATRWMLVGHSMGGKVASVVASRTMAGEQGLFGLSGVVLIAGSPPSPEPMQEDRRQQMLDWAKEGPLQEDAARKFVDDNVGSALPPAAGRIALHDLQSASPQAWSAWLERGSREDWSQSVGTLKLPALILVGGKDGDLGEAGQRATNQIVYPLAKMVVLEGAGHLLPLERPDEVAQAIGQFWRDVAGLGPVVPAPVARLIASSRVSRRTRSILAARALADSVDYVPTALSGKQLKTLRAVAQCVVPQSVGGIDLAARQDTQLGSQKGDGWRFEGMPPDKQAYALALDGLHSLNSLPETERLQLLEKVAIGEYEGSGLSAKQMQHWFEDVRADLVRLWVAHPATMARIGFDGYATGGDGVRKQGFSDLTAGRREAWEPLMELAR